MYFYCYYHLVTWNTYVSQTYLPVHSIVVPIGNFHFLIALLIARIVLYLTHTELLFPHTTNSSPKSHVLYFLLCHIYPNSSGGFTCTHQNLQSNGVLYRICGRLIHFTCFHMVYFFCVCGVVKSFPSLINS